MRKNKKYTGTFKEMDKKVPRRFKKLTQGKQRKNLFPL